MAKEIRIARMRGSRERRAISSPEPDHEKPYSALWHPVISSVEEIDFCLESILKQCLPNFAKSRARLPIVAASR